MFKGYIYMISTAIAWSFAGVFIRFNSQSAILISLINALIGLIFHCIFNHQKLVFNKTVILAGASQFMMGITFIYANQLTTVGNTIILQYTSMIFVLIYQSIDTRRLPNYREIGIISVVVFGMILFFFDSISLQGTLGNILAIVSGAFYGLQFYMNTKEEAHPYTSMLLSYFISVLLIGFVINDLKTVLPIEWCVMLMSGMICAGIGSFCFTKGIRIINAFTANVICMLEILFSPLWAFLIFHETIGVMSFVGALVIIIGVLIHLYDESRNVRIKYKREEVLE